MRTSVLASLLVCLSSAPALAQETPVDPPAPVPAPAAALPVPSAPPAAPTPLPPWLVAPAPPASVTPPPPAVFDAPPPPPPPVLDTPPPPPARPWVPDSDPAPAAPAAAPGAMPPRDTVEGKQERSFHFDAGVATDFPIFVGGYVGAELPGRILLQLGAGAMPAAYSGAVNSVLMSSGAYDQTIGNLVQKVLGNPFVLRASAGWRPFTNHGLEIMGGYTLVMMNGSATEGDIINAVLQEAGSSQRVPAGSGATIPLSATLHNVHVSLGWRWLLADDHLVLRASLSYLQCPAANVGVSLPGQGQAMEALVNQPLNAFVSPYLTSYVKTPLVGLSAAYRF